MDDLLHGYVMPTAIIVADGTSYTADFSTVNITANRMVTLDTSRNIGTLKFGDPSGVRNWIVTNSSASVLTLNNGSTSPAIVAEKRRSV